MQNIIIGTTKIICGVPLDKSLSFQVKYIHATLLTYLTTAVPIGNILLNYSTLVGVSQFTFRTHLYPPNRYSFYKKMHPNNATQIFPINKKMSVLTQ